MNMGRCKDGDGIKSTQIINEVQKRPCLYDMNNMSYGDRAEKAKCWDEVYETVVPAWFALGQAEKLAAGKEVQKRWRSIRDSYTKAYRQGKCMRPEECPPGSRKFQYHKQMSFLLKALQNKKQRSSQDKYESFSEVSNSPQHAPPEDIVLKIKTEPYEKPLDLKTKQFIAEKPENIINTTTNNFLKQRNDTQTQTQTQEAQKPAVEMRVEPKDILPEDHFDDDRLFMNSLLPLFKKMDDDTRLLCRIEVLKIIRFALQGHKHFKNLKLSEDSFFLNRVTESMVVNNSVPKATETKLSMTTRSADGSRPIRKRRTRSPSPLQVPQKRRGPGRPRKIRPPPSDSEEDTRPSRRATPKLRVCPLSTGKLSFDSKIAEMERKINLATRVDQLDTPAFMKMYNLERSKCTSTAQSTAPIKSEPID